MYLSIVSTKKLSFFLSIYLYIFFFNFNEIYVMLLFSIQYLFITLFSLFQNLCAQNDSLNKVQILDYFSHYAVVPSIKGALKR